ncbi:EamA family transporter [bacterium]|nr:MAG: EamA family transporter [bacterium]
MTAGPRAPALAALIALALIWGYNWVVVKVGVAYMSPFAFGALRSFLGALAIFAAMVALRRPLRPQYPLTVFWLGLFQTAGFTGFSTWALVSGGAGQTAVLAYTMPFWTLLLAWPLLGERLGRVQYAAVAVALIGLALILDPAHLGGNLGADLLALLSGLSWAISAVIAKRLFARKRLDLLGVTAWQMLFGAIPLVAVALLVPGAPTQWTPALLIALAYSTILGSAVAWFLWLFVLRRLPTHVAGMGSLSNPVVGVLAAWAQLGERPGSIEGLGMVAIVAGLVLVVLGERPDPLRASSAR